LSSSRSASCRARGQKLFQRIDLAPAVYQNRFSGTAIAHGFGKPFMISFPRFAAIGFLLLIAGVGCGRETYVARLDETRRYFAYEERLNQNLTPVAWAGRGFVLRVPKQFVPITNKSKAAEGSEDRDPRQPTFAEGLELPGLQGAWQANFQLTGEGGNGPGWLYLCSNYDFLAKKEDAGKAAGLNAEVILLLAKAVGQQQAKSIEKLPLYEVPPRSEEAFVEKRQFHALNPGIPALIDDKQYRIRIYTYAKEKSPAQICLIYVLPDNVVQASNLDRAIDMSLETLVVTRDKPPAPSGKAGKGKASPSAKSF
jgi:hypothetical protein